MRRRSRLIIAPSATPRILNAALAGREWFHPKDTPWRQMITKKAAENAAMIRPQIHDDEAPANYFRALRDVAAWMPKNAILSAEGAGTMDIGLTQLNVANARSCLNAGTYGTMGVGLGQAIAAAVAEPNRPVVHLSGDSTIGFSGMEMETLVRYNFPVKIVVLNNGGIGPGMPEIPENPMFNMKPNSLIYGARYDRMKEAFGGKGFFVENPKTARGNQYANLTNGGSFSNVGWVERRETRHLSPKTRASLPGSPAQSSE
jgi:2-hydroxyacyl-CoA lyase 1